jgi:hypothetical protein
MTTIQNTTSSKPRSMASVCRRRDQLRREGIRPETLAWAIAEASQAAIELADLPGSDMVRSCLAKAREASTAGPECEALLVFAAAGVNQVRRELRTVGVPVPLTRNEAFRAIRLAQRKTPEPQVILEAIQIAGPTRVLKMMLDRSVPFSTALAREMVAASKDGDKAKVTALTQVGACGVRDLHRGIKFDASAAVRAQGVVTIAGIVAAESPRRALRERSRVAEGDEAERLATLSFARNDSLKRAVRIVSSRCRNLAFREFGRARKEGRPDALVAYRAIKAAGAIQLIEMTSDDDAAFERKLADEVVAAFERKDSERARALIDVGAFGVWRLRHGVKVDVTDEVRSVSARSIAEILAGESPRRALRKRARAAEGEEEAETLAALSFVDPRRLERSVRNALHQCVAAAFTTAKARAGIEGQPLGADRVPGTHVAAAVAGKDGSRD